MSDGPRLDKKTVQQFVGQCLIVPCLYGKHVLKAEL
jgi:hypothetical protein